MKQYLATGKTPKGISTSERKAFILRTVKFTMIDKELYKLGRDGILRRCVPSHARKQVMMEAHAGDSGVHFSVITTKKILQAGLWWDRLAADVME